MCNGNASPNFEYFLAGFFMVTVILMEIAFFFCFGWIDTFSIRKPFGFSKATPSGFVIQKLTMAVFVTLMYLPLLIFGMIVVRLFKDHLLLAFAVGAIFGKLFLLYLFPLLKNCLSDKKIDYPQDRLELKKKIIKLAQDVNYKDANDKIIIISDRGGDLHSNASVNSAHINISEQLLMHHRGKDDEILSIVAHELGHWKNSDIYWIMFVDIFYMIAVGYFF